MLISGDQAHSREFSEDAYQRAAEPKELFYVKGAGHVDLYDRVKMIPFDKLDNEMKGIAAAHTATVAQIATAWAIAKGTLPIIGVTRPKHVEDAAKAAMLELTSHEMCRMEERAGKTPVKTLREWEKDM